MARGLTPKQQRFVAEYLVDLNATAAYRRAGYACRTDNAAAASASALLRNPKVAAAVAEAQARHAAGAGVTAERVLKEVAALAFSDIGALLDFTGDEPRLKAPRDIPEEARRCISSVKVKRRVEGRGAAARTVQVLEFKLWDKGAALEKLGRRLGLFPHKIDVDSDAIDDAIDRELARVAARGQAAAAGAPEGEGPG